MRIYTHTYTHLNSKYDALHEEQIFEKCCLNGIYEFGTAEYKLPKIRTRVCYYIS